MQQYDNILNTKTNQWQIPEHFNIAHGCIRQHVDQGRGEQLAMIVEDQQRGTSQLTYQQLDEQSGRFKRVLNSLRLAVGDRVLIRLPNSVYYPISFFGVLKHGAIAVPTSTLLSASEVVYLAKDSGAKVLVTDQCMWSELVDMLDQLGSVHTVLLTGAKGRLPVDDKINNHGVNDNERTIEVIDLEQVLTATDADNQIVNTLAQDPAYLVYTSGTTGFPKGVLHGHKSLLGRLPASRYWFDFKSADRVLHSGKFNWTYVLGSALMDPLFHGHSVIVYEGENRADVWPMLINKHRCTIFIGVPTIYRQIIEKTQVKGEDLPSLRHCMSAGEHLSDEMLARWRQRFAMDVYEAIGMSECSYYISQRTDMPIRPGSAGFVQPGHRVALLNDQFEPVTDNQEGMIVIEQGDPGLFLRYWQRPDETAMSHQRGYFITGDYARRDDDGYIWFIGRKDEIINTFGYRVSPYEIERVMKTHPLVSDCVALAENISPDKAIVSICVISEGQEPGNAQQLLDFANAHLARYKAPKKVYFYQQFPRTKNGKVIRKKLVSDIEKMAHKQTQPMDRTIEASS
ncbi:acyl-CoA synthetase [Thalassotalea ponticola]|uniref:acyl-CoA synthetase n=1 Tax=Thalassotalea ponticola TaxID=1523392 RepID=UPI0025B527A1|nr:acyl-CoA synthetase [Thalassotalea ponticola]MDN3651238.1 acyl-CoA synthetase [Thalassotalea ponticola]